MPKTDYANLVIHKDVYLRLKKEYQQVIDPDAKGWMAWIETSMESAMEREYVISEKFKGLHFVGKKSDGKSMLIEDKTEGGLVEVTPTKDGFKCSVHKGMCRHIMFACVHPMLIS